MNKKIKKPFDYKRKTDWVRFDKFCNYSSNEKGTLWAEDCLNCDCKGGVLRAGIGLEEFYFDDMELPTNIFSANRSAEYFPWYRMLSNDSDETTIGVLLSGSMLYYFDSCLEEWVIDSYLNGSGSVGAWVSEDFTKSLILMGRKGIYYDSINGRIEAGISGIDCACVCGDRVFAVMSEYTLAYSKPRTPTDFSEEIDDGGKIYLSQKYGQIVTMKECGGRVYIFYDTGIMMLQPSGAAREFVLKELAYNGGRIYGSWMGRFDNRLVFLAENGVHILDGETIRRAYKNLNLGINLLSKISYGAILNDKCIFQYQDESANMVSVVLDSDEKSFYRCSFFPCLGNYNKDTLCVLNSKVWKVTEDGAMRNAESRKFITKPINFGYHGRKMLKRLRFWGEGTLLVWVMYEDKSKSSFVSLKNGTATVDIYAASEEYTLKISLAEGACVRGMEAEIEHW